jgi:hypothetical protein
VLQPFLRAVHLRMPHSAGFALVDPTIPTASIGLVVTGLTRARPAFLTSHRVYRPAGLSPSAARTLRQYPAMARLVVHHCRSACGASRIDALTPVPTDRQKCRHIGPAESRRTCVRMRPIVGSHHPPSGYLGVISSHIQAVVAHDVAITSNIPDLTLRRLRNHPARFFGTLL